MALLLLSLWTHSMEPVYQLTRSNAQFFILFCYRGSGLNYLSDLFVMGGALILESNTLLQWCEKQGYGPFAFHGVSMGGYVSIAWISMVCVPGISLIVGILNSILDGNYMCDNRSPSDFTNPLPVLDFRICRFSWSTFRAIVYCFLNVFNIC